ncbi:MULTISPECIES: PIN domain-containing protein [Nitrospirillum]|uniref:Ribonuclease VapC n=1 Tax=Nitrospirillum viridazoti CBAmc TaxID=1441467 RepID=A0A248JXB0_9PROT|nr:MULTISPECIES: PIN domain-containing protein [Nitrospirillum]ASG23219.1 VapC toxin family PIN domain ribonuclease [Nitrospirillum amazonense CBAmc]MEA1673973.1 PIN domain-containing protein [Nitrospirillum sp. BR 11163]TWB38977.1 hypothetical protein FBZ91_106310 [Nitrospirillum amazonense]
MTYVVDTCVLSDLRRGTKHPELLRWWTDTSPDQLLVPAVVISEIERGITRLRIQGRIAEANDNDLWFRALTLALPIIPYDGQIARLHGALSISVPHDGTPSFERDLMIAATALDTGAIIATRNIRHFSLIAASTGLELLNPYDSPINVEAQSG